MKVLCCLLSDQHVPNLLSIQHHRPDRLVLIESVAMKKKDAARNLLEALKLGGLDYDQRCDVEILDREDHLPTIQVALQRACDKHPNVDWIVNLTGGTKPMSIAAYEFVKSQRGRHIYTNVYRPAEFLDLETGLKEEGSHHLTIREFLAGYGFVSRKSDQKIAEAEARARAGWDCARNIAEDVQPEDLLILEDDERKKARERGCRISRGQLRPPSESARRALVDLFGLDSDLCGQVDKYAARFLTGGWLEEFLWGVIERHQDSLQVWNVRLGVEVARKGDSSGNDLDIAFIRNHGLAMVECKSGGQEHDPSGEILYKVEAVKRQFGAIRVQSILATTSDKILEQNGSLKTTFENRADIYQCRILSRAEIRRLGKEADSADEVRRILFDPVGQA